MSGSSSKKPKPCDDATSGSESESESLGPEKPKLFVGSVPGGASSSSGTPTIAVPAAIAAPAAAAPATAARAGCDPATYRASATETVIEWWDGRFPFARIRSGKKLIGWGCTCGSHTNADGSQRGTACKKTVAIGALGLSEDDARKRLKRWVIMGHLHELDPLRERASHIGIGGRYLEQLADTSTVGSSQWAELDADLDTMIANL